MALNKIILEQDGLVVGDQQLVASGDSISIRNNLNVGANSYAKNIIADSLYANNFIISNGPILNSSNLLTNFSPVQPIYLSNGTNTYLTIPVSTSFYFNFKYNYDIRLNDVMKVGQTIICNIAVNQLSAVSTTYGLLGAYVDDRLVDVQWLNGQIPSGNSFSTDFYIAYITKLSNNNFSVLIKQERYANVYVVGQQSFTTPGTFTWTAPAGVTSVSVVAVGGGGGGNSNWAAAAGSGGGLGWRNKISVVPGTSYTVVVGAGGSYGSSSNAGAGGTSYFINVSTVAGYGGGNASSGASTGGPNSNGYGGGWFGDGGGAGGNAPNYQGGGGAGGYTGNGGTGGSGAGSGGGGGGGSYFSSTYGTGAGGGVGILGQGSNGLFAQGQGTSSGYGGGGGSGGSAGANGEPNSSTGTSGTITGGAYGGGGGGPGTTVGGGYGGGGAVRIIWSSNPTIYRAFPLTNTGNL